MALSRGTSTAIFIVLDGDDFVTFSSDEELATAVNYLLDHACDHVTGSSEDKGFVFRLYVKETSPTGSDQSSSFNVVCTT